MIITIARECGCNGDVVGQKLSEFYGIPLYDKRAMVRMAKENGLYERTPNFFVKSRSTACCMRLSQEGRIRHLSDPDSCAAQCVGWTGLCGNWSLRQLCVP